MEKSELRLNGLVPVRRGVGSFRGEECVFYTTAGHGFVQMAVDFIKEIFCAAVEYDVPLSRLHFFNESHYSMVGPPTGIFSVRAKAVGYIPFLGERTYVNAAGCGTDVTEKIGMTQTYPETAVSTHAQTGDGAVSSGGTGSVVGIDPRHEFLDDVAFHLHGRIDW